MNGDEGDDESSPGRIHTGPVRTWLLLESSRRVLAAILLVGVYLAVVAVLVAWPNPLVPILDGIDPEPYLFQALLTGAVTTVTIVVTINQLVLSQELGAVGDQRSRMSESMKFRKDVEDRIETDVAPPTPAAFLQSLVDASCEAAERLSEAVGDGTDPELRSRIDTYVETLVDNADDVTESLEDAQFGTFQVVMAALNYNYSYKIYQGRKLQSDGEDRLSEPALEALEEVVAVLEFFGPAREHFKTLYFQWELTNLSQSMIYAALPSIVVASGAVLLLGDATQLPGTTLGVANFTWIFAGAVAVSLTPLALLLSYLVRIVVVTKWTLAMGPFILREADRVGDEGG